MEFNELVKKYIERVEIALSENVLVEPKTYNRLLKAMEYSVFAGGKRIRPLLTIACNRLLKGDETASILLGCAVECVHTASLIHDDLPCMDNSPTRRGKKTCHIQFDEPTALLAGTALYYKALDLIVKASDITRNNDLVHDAVKDLNDYAGVDGMMGGQQIDMDYKGKEVSKEILFEMDNLKTAKLITMSCRFGGYAGYSKFDDENDIEILTKFGDKLGLAFQINDDILDLEGDKDILGKPTSKDIEENKKNNASFYGVDRARKKVLELTEEAISHLDEFDDFHGRFSIDKEFLINLSFALAKRKF